VRDRALASELVEAVAGLVAFVAELQREAAVVEVGAARAVVVDQAVEGEQIGRASCRERV